MALNRIAWIGRLTGPKGDIAMRIIQEVAPKFPDVQFTIVGGPVTDEYRTSADENITLTDFVSDVQAIFAASDLVIGAGRVPIEAMRFGLPVIAVGENRYIGPIDGDSIAEAKATNFGDCDQLQSWEASQLVGDLEALVSGAKVLPVEKYASYLSEYELSSVYPKVMDAYRRALIDSYLERFKELPILTYHRVLTAPPEGSKFNIYVSVEELEQQIKTLKRRGFEFLTFKDIANGVRAKKPVVLTFDDGYRDNYENLLPLLQKYEAKAVIFALADRSIRNNYWDMGSGEPEAPLMDDSQLIACHESGYVEVASHGLSHQHLPQLSDEQAREEVFQSKQRLEELIGDEVVSFAYPYGDYGDREARLVGDAGYPFGVGTVNGPLRIADDLMRVRRITMFPNTKPAKFWRKTSGFYLRYCKIKGKDF